MIIISPHLDDAVFSCGTLIAAAALAEKSVLVITVFAGVPEEGVLSFLDERAGFTSSREAMIARRAEDAEALVSLGTNVRLEHLHLLDQQYEEPAVLETDRVPVVREAIELVIPDGNIIGPLGLVHPDHIVVARALLGLTAYVYEDMPYRVNAPGQIPKGFPKPTLELPWCAAKDKAIRCYKSQLGDGPPGDDLAENERYHRT